MLKPIIDLRKTLEGIVNSEYFPDLDNWNLVSPGEYAAGQRSAYSHALEMLDLAISELNSKRLGCCGGTCKCNGR